MKFDQPSPRSRTELLTAFESDDYRIVIKAIISAALYENDREFVEGVIVRFLEHKDPLLKRLLSDPETKGKAEDAFEEIAKFVGR